MLLSVVEVTLVVLSIAMFSAEHVLTLAGEAKKAYLSLTFPACILVNLKQELVKRLFDFLNSYLDWPCFRLGLVSHYLVSLDFHFLNLGNDRD